MDDSSNGQIARPPTSSEQARADLESKRALLRELQQKSRWGTLLTVTGGALALGALVWSSLRIGSAERTLDQLNSRSVQLQSQISELEAKRQSLEDNLARNQKGAATALNAVLSTAGPSATQALRTLTSADVDASQAVPVIYLIAATPEQLAQIGKVAQALRKAEFVVPKAGFNPSAAKPFHTELRYFAATNQTEQDIKSIQSCLGQFDITATPLIPKIKVSEQPPLRQYEIWFGQGDLAAAPNPQTQASSENSR
jgi:hypothetical protein